MEEETSGSKKEFVQAIYTLFSSLLFCGVVCYSFLEVEKIGKLVLLPFLVCGLAVLLQAILLLITVIQHKKGNYNVDFEVKAHRFLSNLYLGGFLVFWFGFLCVFDYLTITRGEFLMALFTIPFWIVGVVLLIKKWVR